MISKILGKGLTEYKHKSFNDLEDQCQLFFTCSQFRSLEGKSFEELEAMNIPFVTCMPKCGSGQKVFGILHDRTVVKLIAIIDSSD